MGSPKGLLILNERPLILHHVDALAPFVERVVAVVGSHEAAHRAILEPTDVDVVVNADWATTWPADSLRLALLAHPNASRILVTPVDTPPARPETLRALLGRGAAVPVGARGPGHPVFLDGDLADRIRQIAPPGGLRAILDGARRVAVEQTDVALDFDTVADWDAFSR